MSKLHTFGGSALDRLIFEYEAIGDASEGGEAGADPSPGSDPGEAVSSTVETGAAPAWTPDDPAFIEAVEARTSALLEHQLAPLMPLLQSLSGNGGTQTATAPTPGPLDPWDEGFGTNLDARFQALRNDLAQMIGQVTQPLAGMQEAQSEAQANEAADAWIKAEIAKNGEFPKNPETGKSAAQEAIRPLARMLFPEYEQRYGFTDRAGEMAFQKASQLVREIVAEARTAGVAGHTERIDALAGARTEAGVNGVGVETMGDKPLTSRELALKYGAKATALTRV